MKKIEKMKKLKKNEINGKKKFSTSNFFFFLQYFANFFNFVQFFYSIQFKKIFFLIFEILY